MSQAILADVLFVLVFFAFIAFGIHRGFIKSFVRSASLLLSLASAFFFGGILSDAIGSRFVDRWAYEGTFDTVERALAESAGAIDVWAFLDRFPRFLIGEAQREQIASLLENGTGERLSASLAAQLSAPVASTVSSVLGYGAVFVLSFFLLRLLSGVGTAIVEKIAPLRTMNRLLGGVWGALAGGVCLLTAALFVKLLFRDTELYTDSVIVRGFCDCAFLSFLNF